MAWIILVLSYFLGSLPTAYIAGRLLNGKDIRQMGDFNSGAANAYREIGAKTGIIVGIVDAAKGALAVLLSQAAGSSEIMVLLAGLAVMDGHNWPVFLGFRGGRGVSTSIGILLVVYTLPTLIIALPCLLVLILTKSVNKAMAVFYIPLFALGWWLELPAILIGYSLLLPIIIGLTHYARIRKPRARFST
jgi:acyl phosphate:glycerol-3-phosphate acyltransferase